MRFNDFLFAAHGAAMTAIIYSQFFPRVWGFTVGRSQKVSRAVLGIWWGLVAGVFGVLLLALWGSGRGYNAEDWAWIDVVRLCGACNALWYADTYRFTLLAMSS